MKAGTTPHIDAGQHILTDGFISETMRRDDRDFAGCQHFWRRKGRHTAIMIAMTMREEYPRNRSIAKRLAHQLHPSSSGLNGGERIDDDPAGLAPDDRHHRNIIAPNLIDTGHHLKQAMFGIQL